MGRIGRGEDGRKRKGKLKRKVAFLQDKLGDPGSCLQLHAKTPQVPPFHVFMLLFRAVPSAFLLMSSFLQGELDFCHSVGAVISEGRACGSLLVHNFWGSALG